MMERGREIEKGRDEKVGREGREGKRDEREGEREYILVSENKEVRTGGKKSRGNCKG